MPPPPFGSGLGSINSLTCHLTHRAALMLLSARLDIQNTRITPTTHVQASGRPLLPKRLFLLKRQLASKPRLQTSKRRSDIWKEDNSSSKPQSIKSYTGLNRTKPIQMTTTTARTAATSGAIIDVISDDDPGHNGWASSLTLLRSITEVWVRHTYAATIL
jgi:hypothetical protein